MKAILTSISFGNGEILMVFDCAYRDTALEGTIDVLVNGDELVSDVEPGRVAQVLEALAFDAQKGTAGQRGARTIVMALAGIALDNLAADACGVA